MKINMRALAVCTMSSILMTACASLENLKGENTSSPIVLQPQTHLSQSTNSSTLPVPKVTKTVTIPGDGPLIKAQRHFHQEEYGLAEKLFREASLENPKSLDAVLGLAASYDQLKRFDLANRSYRRAIKLGGRSLTLLNNWGYSYLLRGNVVQARKKFLAAYEIDPKNEAVNANLDLLREGLKRNRRSQT